MPPPGIPVTLPTPGVSPTPPDPANQCTLGSPFGYCDETRCQCFDPLCIDGAWVYDCPLLDGNGCHTDGRWSNFVTQATLTTSPDGSFTVAMHYAKADTGATLDVSLHLASAVSRSTPLTVDLGTNDARELRRLRGDPRWRHVPFADHGIDHHLPRRCDDAGGHRIS